MHFIHDLKDHVDIKSKHLFEANHFEKLELTLNVFDKMFYLDIVILAFGLIKVIAALSFASCVLWC